MNYMDRVRQAVADGDRYIVVTEITHPSGGGYRRYEGLRSECPPLAPKMGGRLEEEVLSLDSAAANEASAAAYYDLPLMHPVRS